MIRYCMELDTSLSYIKETISTSLYCREPLSCSFSLGNMKMNAIIILSLLLKLAVSIERIPDADDSLHIYALPVGQGDCTVIQCPQGNGGPAKGVVSIIDAGSRNSMGIDDKGIVKFLKGTRLNFAVITHSDKDHLSYMDTILNYYGETYMYKRETGKKKKFTVYHSCAWSSYDVESEYAEPKEVKRCVSIEKCKKFISELKLCPHLKSGQDDHTLSFVASAFGRCNGKDRKATNEDFIISMIMSAGRLALITGDFELKKNDMERFLKEAGADLMSDIYRLSHHGAWNKKANQKQFLNPFISNYVFSSSECMYGHPRCEIYDYYKEELLDIVAKHPYTCYDEYKPRNEETRKPIYVTSLIRKNFNGVWIKSYYLIKFNIDPLGNICVEFIHMRDETK